MAGADASKETQESDSGMTAECKVVVSMVDRANGNLYEVLGLKNDENKKVTPEEAETAFRGLAPAVFPKSNPSPEAKAAFKLLLQALRVLSDPEAKKKYDELGIVAEDLTNLNPSIDIRDILTTGQNLKNLPLMHRKIMEANDDLYAILSAGAVTRLEGRSLPRERLSDYFRETESALEMGGPEHVMTFALCCNKLEFAWNVLGEDVPRRAYDLDEDSVEACSSSKEGTVTLPEDSSDAHAWSRRIMLTLLVAISIWLMMQASTMPPENGSGLNGRSRGADL